MSPTALLLNTTLAYISRSANGATLRDIDAQVTRFSFYHRRVTRACRHRFLCFQPHNDNRAVGRIRDRLAAFATIVYEVRFVCFCTPCTGCEFFLIFFIVNIRSTPRSMLVPTFCSQQLAHAIRQALLLSFTFFSFCTSVVMQSASSD